MTDSAPLIVTALLPADRHARYTRLRAAHFPPERNYLEAHVTLFHALPPSARDEVHRALASECAALPPLAAREDGLMNLGRGTAIRLVCPPLLALRARLADRFHGVLTAQDQHAPRLHVTVQNKVTPDAARALQGELDGRPWGDRFAFRGLGLFAYRGGPWERLREYPFRGAE